MADDGRLRPKRFRSVNRPPPTDYPDFPRWIASSSNLAFDPATSGIGPTVTIAPPAEPMNVGDLVVVFVVDRQSTGVWAVLATGGQAWIKCTSHITATPFRKVAAFFCRFNGAWTGSPSFTVTGSTETMIGVMHVFRGTNPANRWALDQSPALGEQSGSGFTVVGVTPQSQNTVAIACIASSDDNEWTLTTPGRWSRLGNKQYRNTAALDASMTFVQLCQKYPVATGNVTLTEATLGPDVGITMILVFKEGEDFQIGADSGNTRAPFTVPAARGRKRNSQRAFTDTPAAGGNDMSATGELSITGAADLDATGSLVAAGVLSITGAADLDALGSLVAVGAISISGVADLDASGALVAVGALSISGSADLDAIGQLLAAGSIFIIGNADLTSAATDDIAAIGSLSIAGSAELDAIGALLAAGDLSITGIADLTSGDENDLEAAGSLVIAGSASLTALGALIASGSIVIDGAADLTDANAAGTTPGGGYYLIFCRRRGRR